MLVFVDTPFSTVNHTYQILLGKLSLTSRVAENCSYSLQMNLLHVWVLNNKQKHIIILTCWGLSISVVHWWPEEWDWCAQLMELSLICWRTLQLRQEIQMIQNNPSILPINMCPTHGEITSGLQLTILISDILMYLLNLSLFINPLVRWKKSNLIY